MNNSSSPRLTKPAFGKPCNRCGYCCTAEPCQLANEYLHCLKGPCVALEEREGRYGCGLVRNPLGYLYAAANPNSGISPLDESPLSEEGHQLSVALASALGLGKGCDSADDEESAQWKVFVKA